MVDNTSGTPIATPNVRVSDSAPLVDPVRHVSIRTGLYDSATGTLYVGGGQGHMSLARDAGILDKSLNDISGLEIVEGANGISFRARSGFYNRPLSPAEQEAVGKALQAHFGKAVTYDANLNLARPGGAP
jgi:hypothetical protein